MTQLPNSWSRRLSQEKFGKLAHSPVPHDKIGSPGENRLKDAGDIRGLILIVRVGVHDVICPLTHRSLEASAKGCGQAQVPLMTDHVMDPEPTGYGRGLVAAAIVDDQIFDAVDSGQRDRQVPDGPFQGSRLVETRDLNDQLGHRAVPVMVGAVCGGIAHTMMSPPPTVPGKTRVVGQSRVITAMISGAERSR